MDPSGRNTDLNLLPIETQIKVLKKPTEDQKKKKKIWSHHEIFGQSILTSK